MKCRSLRRVAPQGRLFAALTMTVLLAAGAKAQMRPRTVIAADSAFAAGNVLLADSLYYIGVRMRPRDPLVREALGRYLGAQGRAKVAVVLLEESRMFGGDPAVIARQLAPLYAYLGEWRALLTLPGSPLSTAERRRAAWLSEHPFGPTADNGAASIIGKPAGDTIARVAVRIGGRAAVASIVGSDVGFIAGSRIAGAAARRFEGDTAIVAFDSMTVGQVKFINVPARIGEAASTMTIGVASLGRLVVMIDYGRNRIAMMRSEVGTADSRYPLVRESGQLRVLDGGRWVSLGDFAAAVAKAAKTMIIDVAAGELRVRP